MTYNQEHQVQHLVLYMVAFFEYNIQLDLVVIHDVIHQEEYKAKIIIIRENKIKILKFAKNSKRIFFFLPYLKPKF